MSTYDDDEKSVSDARPVELYTIITPTTTYYLTSYSQDVTFGGTTFKAAPIDRDNVAMLQLGQTREVMVQVSLDHALAQDVLVGGVPQSGISVEIDCLMQRSGVTRMIHLGLVTSIASDGIHVKLLVPNKLDVKIGGVMLPVIVAQRLCQHGLYDTGCTINPASFTVSTNVGSVSPDGLTITVTGMGGHPDQWARYGKIVNPIGNEPRSVLSQVGNVITIDYPFRSVNLGGSISVVAGCDHTVFTCRDTFANVVNYGGHPLLPTINIQSPTGIGVLVQS